MCGSIFLVVMFVIEIIVVPGLGEKAMTGIHLRIAAVDEAPGFQILKDARNGSSRYEGIAPDGIRLLAEYLGFTYSYVEIPVNLVKIMGPTNSSIQYLLENKVDLVSSFAVPTAQRLQLMDFTVPLTVQSYRIVQKMPDLENPLFAMIRPFDSNVWLVLLIAIILLIGAFTLMNRFERGASPRNSLLQIISANVNYVLVVLTGQGGAIPSTRLPFRIVGGVLCLVAIVLVNAYNSTLTSRLSAPKHQPIINSLEELAESENVHVVVSKGTVLASMFQSAKFGSSKKLGDSLRKNPQNEMKTIEERRERLISGCCAFPTTSTMASNLVSNTITRSGSCQLTTSKQISFYQMFSFATHKNTGWLKTMDRQIQYMWANGMLSKYSESVTKTRSMEQCKAEGLRLHKKRPMSLKTLSSAFLILAIGLGISLVALIMEITCRFYNRTRKTVKTASIIQIIAPINEIIAPISETIAPHSKQ